MNIKPILILGKLMTKALMVFGLFIGSAIGEESPKCSCFEMADIEVLVSSGCKVDSQSFQRGMIEENAFSALVVDNPCEVKVYKVIKDVDPYNNPIYSCESNGASQRINKETYDVCRSNLFDASGLESTCENSGIVKVDPEKCP